MSEPPETPLAATPKNPWGQGPRCCLYLLLVLSFVPPGIGVWLQRSSSADLEAKFLEVSEEVTRLQEDGARRRKTLLGGAGDDQNALVDYSGLEWVLKGGGPGTRSDWKPVLPVDIDEVLAQVAAQGEVPTADAGELLRGLVPDQPLTNLSPEDAARYAKAQALYRQYRPVLRYLRAGLERGYCDWETQWDRGISMDMPNFLMLRVAATLMAYEASQQEPSAAIQTGLEVVAFGSDVARFKHASGTGAATRITLIGFRSLSKTLERDGVSAEDCERVLEVTARYRPLRDLDVLSAERVMIMGYALGASGRPLSLGIETDLNEFSDTGLEFDLDCASHIAVYEDYFRRLREHLSLPPNMRRIPPKFPTQTEVSVLVSPSSGTINLFEILDGVDAHLPPLRVLAAARLAHLRDGTIPAQLSQLAPLLGEGGTQDPLAWAAAPLRYASSEGGVRCWSVGTNGGDDGGPTRYLQGKVVSRTDDFGLALELGSQ